MRDSVKVINVMQMDSVVDSVGSRRGELTILRAIRKGQRSNSACTHAKNAEGRASRLRRRGDILAAEVWEHHAAICRRVLGRIKFGDSACTP